MIRLPPSAALALLVAFRDDVDMDLHAGEGIGEPR